MKERTRKKRALFPSLPPTGQFGFVGPDNPAIDGPNPLRRAVLKETSPSTPAVVKQVPIVKDRFLRWYRPADYARNNGFFYHKKDRKWYPVIDTHNPNPHRRYKFLKTFYREKRFYASETRLEIKPYRRMVVDQISAFPFVFTKTAEGKTLKDDLRFSYSSLTPEQWDEAFLYALALQDLYAPLEEYHGLVYVEGEPQAYAEMDEYGSVKYGYFVAPSRVDAFNVDPESVYSEETYGAYSFEYVRLEHETYASRGEIATWDLAIFSFGSFEIPMEWINEKLIQMGAKCLDQLSSGSEVAVFHGLPGPKHILAELHELWYRFSEFQWNRNTSVPDSIASHIPLTDLVGLIGYNRFSKEPIRGLPDLGQFFGEMPETVKSFASLLTSAIKIASSLKKKDFQGALKHLEVGRAYLRKGSVSFTDAAKSASSVDLFFKFGLQPFIEDLSAIAESGSVFGDAILQLDKPRRIRVNWHDSPWSSDRHEFTHASEFELEEESYYITGSSTINARMYCDIEYGARIKIKDPIRFFFEAFGLNSILGTAWELLPLSFVIDWFVNVGEAIRTVTNINLNSFELVDGYMTFTTVCDIVEDVFNVYLDDIPADSDGSNVYRVVEVSRGYFDPRVDIRVEGQLAGQLPSLYEKLIALDLLQPLRTSLLSPSKLGTLAELAVQRVRS